MAKGEYEERRPRLFSEMTASERKAYLNAKTKKEREAIRARPSVFSPAPTLKAQERERDALIAELGMRPEEKTKDGRYAATTGELRKWVAELRESKGLEETEFSKRWRAKGPHVPPTKTRGPYSTDLRPGKSGRNVTG